MDELPIVLYCVFALFVGGLFKGVAGVGLPLVGVPLLTLGVNLKTAVAILVVPLIASNLFQSFEGGYFKFAVRRFWPLYLTLFVVIAVSTRALVTLPERALFGVIGVALIGIPLLARLKPDLRLGAAEERWLAPLAGIFAGFIGGISSYYGPPLMLYVMWLRLPKTEFVVAISQMYTVGSLGLALGLVLFGATTPAALGLSALACAPVFLGLLLGQRVRFRLDERRFELLILAVYIATGLSFVVRAI